VEFQVLTCVYLMWRGTVDRRIDWSRIVVQSFEEREASIDKERKSSPLGIFWIAFITLLIAGLLFMSAWVVMLKITYEPGVHVYIINKTGRPIKNISLTFAGSAMKFNEIPARALESWHKPYGGLLRDHQPRDDQMTIQWTDADGVARTKKEKDLYLNQSSPLVIVTFKPDGTVTVECRSQGLG
jgi:hypothetical protein